MQTREPWELDGYQNQIKSTTTFYKNEICFCQGRLCGNKSNISCSDIFWPSFRDNCQLAHGLTRDPGRLNGGGLSPTGGGHTSMFLLKMVDWFRNPLERLRLKIRKVNDPEAVQFFFRWIDSETRKLLFPTSGTAFFCWDFNSGRLSNLKLIFSPPWQHNVWSQSWFVGCHSWPSFPPHFAFFRILSLTTIYVILPYLPLFYLIPNVVASHIASSSLLFSYPTQSPVPSSQPFLDLAFSHFTYFNTHHLHLLCFTSS